MTTINEVYDCLFTRPYAEDDYLLNRYVDRIYREVAWNLVRSQEKFCELATEENPPILKDNALDLIEESINESLSGLCEYLVCKLLICYRAENIDLGENCEEYLKLHLVDNEEDDWEDFNSKMNEYIWKDYCRHLGEERAKEYFTRINRPELIPTDI